MSSEREKLIEIWLDSASERQYQFAFRNALLSAGYIILHDTSHTALELGKDVIAVSPSGELFAYQLKGNPGGRITVSQWHALIAQINTLVYQPVSHPSVKPGTRHTPVLVTNGEIHEDVYAAIASFNTAITGPVARPLQTIARGQMLRQILDSADTVWPVDVPTQRRLLNIFASPGDDELPSDEFIGLLGEVLKGKNYNATAIPSVHLVTSILASNWIGYKNYFELVKMYALLAVAVACYQARWKRQRKVDVRFLDEILLVIHSHLRSFIDDLCDNFKRGPLLNRNVLSEFAYYHPRKKMIAGLLSVAILDDQLGLNQERRDFLWELICKAKHSKFFLWEGMVPFCLAEFWALSNIQGTKEPDRRLFVMLNDILKCNGNEATHVQLVGPYYTLDEVVRWQYRIFLQTLRSPLDRDDHYRRSWFAEPLFVLLVRRNYKSACKAVWPEITRFIHMRTRLPAAADFGPTSCDNAVTEDRLIDTSSAKTWDEVTKEAGQPSAPRIPAQLLQRPALILLYCLFAPQRMDRDVILWLDRAFCKT